MMTDARRPTLLVCGDSIFDNTPYVGPNGRDVRSHLHELAPDWTIDFRALDGAVCDDVRISQIRDADAADVLVLSVGGNDALGHLHRLGDPTGSTFLETALVLADIQSGFRDRYRRAVSKAERACRRLIAATIYRPRYHLDGYPEEMTRAIDPLLSIFNDVIQEEAKRVGAEILDLRRICVADGDFANPIEPSDPGGRKIVEGIVAALRASPA